MAVVRANLSGPASEGQVVFALTLLLVFGILFHLVSSVPVRATLLAFEFLLTLFIAVITGAYVWSQGLLVVPLVVQLGGIATTPLFVTLSIGGMIVFFYREEAIVVWGTPMNAPANGDRLVLVGITMLVAAVVGLVVFAFEWYRRQELLVDNLKKNIVNLTQANYSFQKYASAADESARQEERLRITREIHDSIGYTMTTLRMMLEAGKDLIANSPLRLEMHLEKALRIVETGNEDVRTALRQLRGHESDHATGLLGLKDLIDLFAETTGITIAVSWGDIPWSIPKRTEGALYRFVQEAMSNALSHGNATELRISFRRSDGFLVAGVADNGVGADTIIEGIGLQGMRERITVLGGTIEATSSSVGFLVEARFPLQEVPA